MRRIIVIGATLLATAGCATQQQMEGWDASRCSHYGYERGTDGFANCMMHQDITRRQMMNAVLLSN